MRTTLPLELVVLARRPRGYTSRRLREAGVAAGHRVRVLGLDRLRVCVDGTRVHVRHGAAPLAVPDGVWLRSGGVELARGLGVLEGLAAGGAWAWNSVAALQAFQVPLLPMVALARAGIPVVAQASAGRSGEVLDAVHRVGGLPVEVRGQSRQGEPLALPVRLPVQARAASQLMLQWGGSVVVARRVETLQRVLVVDGRAMAAVVETGGNVAKAGVGNAAARLAVAATRALGLGVAGVDVALDGDGPAVARVSVAPALEALEVLAGLDVAKRVVAAWASVTRASRGGKRL